ncbi:MAG: ABC transporter ATP-binding protein [Lachnospira sp.]|nr:ABC transporter ATP-binding protein [Lachnospira sp.]
MKSIKAFIKVMQAMGKRCIIYLTAIFFMSSGFAMFSVMSSLLMKNVVDAAQSGRSDEIAGIIVFNIIGGFISIVVFALSSMVYNVEAKRAYSNLCKRIFHHVIRLPYTYYEQNHSGDFMSKLSYDLSKTGSITGSRFRRTVAPLIQVGVFLVPMFMLSWQITLCLVGVNVLMLLINGLLINPIQNVTKALSKTNASMTEKLSNLLQGMEQARMYETGKDTVEAFIKENKTYEKQSNKRILYTACLESSNKGFDLLCILAFLILGIYFVDKGYTTLGSLTAIYTLYGHFSAQFILLGRYLPELIGCLTNAQNIFEFLEICEEPACCNKIESADLTTDKVADSMVRFENICFNYSDKAPLLENFSLDIKKGESVAITGPSGCGKTTLSKLMLCLYPVKSGKMYIDNMCYSTTDNSDIRKKIAYVPQEPYLFNESIMENIRVGRPDATDEEVYAAATIAHAHEFITNLENGYNTYAGERGNRLSGGQRQRIAIARAILKDAPVILMDEATSALDNESEQLVNDALRSLKNSKTIIMIAHRPSTIALADRVVQM